MATLNKISSHAHWFLRVALASVFLFHGVGKFSQLTQIAEMMQMPVMMVLMLALAETFGAVLVLLGGFLKDWMTRLGALLLAPVMLGAIFMVHWGQWSFAASETHPMGGMEFQVTLLLILLYLLIKGKVTAIWRHSRQA
ncbi:MAG: DoxX family protein, partial [Bacteroidota bacterium]